jgi:hypothetical protein
LFRHGRKLRLAGIAVTAIVLGAFVLHALQRYLSGNGIETYRNARGALMNYAGAVVTVGVFVLCMAAALVARWWHHRQERKFEEFLRERAGMPNTADEKSSGIGS